VANGGLFDLDDDTADCDDNRSRNDTGTAADACID
jgi:hypothetical protein